MVASDAGAATGLLGASEPNMTRDLSTGVEKYLDRLNLDVYGASEPEEGKTEAENNGYLVPFFNISIPLVPPASGQQQLYSLSEPYHGNQFTPLLRGGIVRSWFHVPSKHHLKGCFETDRHKSQANRLRVEAESGPAYPHNRGNIASSLPLELWKRIVTDLPREDILSLRLVNHQISEKVSSDFGALFRRAVVPFQPGIYGLLQAHLCVNNQSELTISAGNTKEGTFHGIAKEHHKLGDGLDMFRQFGHHFRELCIQFHVTELDLCSNLTKELPWHSAFWGAYQWHSPESNYTRYASCALLEEVADEMPCMRAAFSHLHNLETFAFDFDCGHGWLQGPDVSMRSQIIGQTEYLFSGRRFPLDSIAHKQQELWKTLEFTFGTDKLAAIVPYSTILDHGIEKNLLGTPRVVQRRHSKITPVLALHTCTREPTRSNSLSRNRNFSGETSETSQNTNTNDDCMHPSNLIVLAYSTLLWTNNKQQATDEEANSISQEVKHLQLRSRSLTSAQKAYILESSWVVDALLCSQIIAVIDNPAWSQNIKNMILRLNSTFLPKLHRHDFWAALSGLVNLDIRVIPSWREFKLVNDFAKEEQVQPSSAIGPYHELLLEYISKLKHVKKLMIGWEHGGEQAQGQFARNDHILPAPICDRSKSTAFIEPGFDSQGGLSAQLVLFEHVEDLTFHNCWFSPDVLQLCIRLHSDCNLRQITLDSVSMTCCPRFPRDLGENEYRYTPQRSQRQASVRNSFRKGSWPDLFHCLIVHFLDTPPKHAILVKLLSCGHVYVNAGYKRDTGFDQSALYGINGDIESLYPARTRYFFAQRRSALRSAMMDVDENYFGIIALKWLDDEIGALTFGYKMHKGWPTLGLLPPEYDDDNGWGRYGKENAKAPFADGWPRGGTGRFSGKISWDTLGGISVG